MTRRPAEEEAPLTVPAAAKRLGLPKRSVYDLIHAGKLACLRYDMPGGRHTYRIEATEITRYKRASLVPAHT